MESSAQPTSTSSAPAQSAQTTGNNNGAPSRPIEGRVPPNSPQGSQNQQQNGQPQRGGQTQPQGNQQQNRMTQPQGQLQSGQQQGEISQQDQQSLQQQLEMLDLKEEDKKKYLELDVAGKKERKTVEEWLNLANKGFAATKMWQETAQARQAAAEYQQLMQLAQQSPEMAAQILFKQNPQLLNKFADTLVAKRLEMQMMSPVERENLELKEQQELQRHQQQEWARQQQQQVQNQLNLQAQQQVDQEMKQELKRIALPDNRYTRSLVAHKVYETWDERAAMGLPPLSTAEAADMLKGEMFALWHSTFDGLSDEQLLEAIGDRTSERINDIRVQRITGKNQPRPTQNRPGPSGPTSGMPEKPMTESEYREYHQKLRYGG